MALVQGNTWQVESLPGVVGQSASMQRAAERVALIAQTDVTCLLSGETGTGKELFARAIHYLGGRKHGPFVPVNCGAIPDHLFENELFGHRRGAYTDAQSNEVGLLAYAENGTLLLDEVDALSASAQVKILRVLQEREYRPVGSAHIVPANIRIVAATNCNLLRRIEARQFREDLYFRLNVLSLTIPPLRERLDDVPLLAAHYVREYASAHHRAVTGFDDSMVARLQAYRWPGNVRELQTVVQRAVLTAKSPLLTAADLDLPEAAPNASAHLTLKAAKSVAVSQCERTYLSAVLQQCEGNVTQAAKLAGKERRSFQRLLRKYSIAVLPFRRGGRSYTMGV
jgi:two-component system response regulator GlrR